MQMDELQKKMMLEGLARGGAMPSGQPSGELARMRRDSLTGGALGMLEPDPRSAALRGEPSPMGGPAGAPPPMPQQQQPAAPQVAGNYANMTTQQMAEMMQSGSSGMGDIGLSQKLEPLQQDMASQMPLARGSGWVDNVQRATALGMRGVGNLDREAKSENYSKDKTELLRRMTTQGDHGEFTPSDLGKMDILKKRWGGFFGG